MHEVGDVGPGMKRRPPTVSHASEVRARGTVKALPKTGQNAAPGGISRPQLALRGTSLEPVRFVTFSGSSQTTAPGSAQRSLADNRGIGVDSSP